ncbi:MAG: peroxide stress protein YaaA [Cellvibrionales bacterium]|nr:peroxide stress protein YaaA [Cellvibrionales bacterium]
MLVVISPAKSLDYATPPTTRLRSQPEFAAESAALVARMREYSPPQLERLMGISKKLADLNFGRFLQWSETADAGNAKQALLAFTGDVYAGLRAETFSEDDLRYAQEHLRILSGLYGVLKPLDMMQPYRLEMGTRLRTERGANLYDFWGERIAEALNAQLASLGSAVLVNLASQEYFKAVRRERLAARVVSPVFKDYKNGVYKIISFYAKKARGLMSAWILQQRVAAADDLRDFAGGGYRYNAAESAAVGEPVFLRKST